ncbi:TPM domain-containing protein [Roseateles saccharophilus]|uniref:TLP18.3/Psb32/MOLO-1 phosphatase superfamily protein n=1 Tax=Roseateles saccharophilus TaxID=304 RepID=A0A4R3UV70_ROSSA|nr:TPM domain-containing protein [Roseateles saccharophilus]MDG0833179.1 hypothetical protein [Roseateles saccharophilus]TCU94647.1 TLP18.3/Psb32/MOLO-1 phosphatase superfamily protein [Roseateles saccharophilus]
MNIKRIAKHLTTSHAQVRRAFPPSTLAAIEKAIKASEAAHAGEVRFAVEGALDGAPLFKGQPARERAIDVFSQLRIWDTQHNNGLLIYLLLADRAVEIVADRGIHAKVNPHEWSKVCRNMEAAFQQSNFEGGVIDGVQAVTRHLVEHFPADGGRIANELPDRPVVL